MGRIYMLRQQRSITASVVQFWEITPADDKPVKFLGMRIAQTTLYKDANETTQSFNIQSLTGSLVAGTGGAAQGPTKVNDRQPAAAFTAREGDTAAATGTTTAYYIIDAFNVRGGYEIWMPKGLEPIVRQGNGTTTAQKMVCALTITPTATSTYNWTAWFEEL